MVLIIFKELLSTMSRFERPSNAYAIIGCTIYYVILDLQEEFIPVPFWFRACKRSNGIYRNFRLRIASRSLYSSLCFEIQKSTLVIQKTFYKMLSRTHKIGLSPFNLCKLNYMKIYIVNKQASIENARYLYYLFISAFEVSVFRI